ncbi:MAG: hypothetical protein D6732_04085 [Methanobacteriota archaeon]|nr:MAG: hypothetical protein D6732_04085 [Euryarchaeota archaeon]
MFLELYALHVLIATIFSYLVIPLLPSSLTKPYLQFGSALRKGIYETIEKIYEKKTIELYLTSRIFTPFVIFVILSSFVLDFIVSAEGLIATQFLGWLLYGSLVINSVPSIEEWDHIVQGDPISWAFVWIKVTVIIDFLGNQTFDFLPPFATYVAIFFPFSVFFPEGETRFV